MKYDADLYIIAAGKGSRMGGKVPKALVPITDEPNLATTLKQIGSKFKNVFIVTNNSIQLEWDKFFTLTEPSLLKNVINLPIDSGLGDGHAVLEALEHPKMDNVDQCTDIVICWGDVFFQHGEIIDEMMQQNERMLPGAISIGPRRSAKLGSGSGMMPVVREDNPYVTILTNTEMRVLSADFSKYGESHPTGFHDQSIFRFDRHSLHIALNDLHKAYWKNGRYITQGGELSLLYTFHYFKNAGVPMKAYETIYPTLSFNTPEEVQHIQKEINSKWQNQSS